MVQHDCVQCMATSLKKDIPDIDVRQTESPDTALVYTVLRCLGFNNRNFCTAAGLIVQLCNDLSAAQSWSGTLHVPTCAFHSVVYPPDLARPMGVYVRYTINFLN